MIRDAVVDVLLGLAVLTVAAAALGCCTWTAQVVAD